MTMRLASALRAFRVLRMDGGQMPLVERHPAWSRQSLGSGSFAALVAIVCVGFWIRARGLQHFEPAHWDEGAIWLTAQWFATLGRDGAYRFTNSPPLPPLLYAAAASPFGLTPSAAIWMSVLAGTACILAIYLLVRRLSSSRAGLIAAGLLALSGFQVMYSRLLLTEPFYVLFLLISLLSSVEYLSARALGWLIATAIFASCLQLTKYNGALVALPVLLVLAWESVILDGSERRRAVHHAALLSGIIGGVIVSNLALYARLGLLPTFINHLARYVAVAQVSPLGLVQYLGLVTTRPVLYLSVAGMAYGLLRRRSIAWAIIHLAFVLYVAFLFTYTFYLRLLAPISVFLIVYAALFIDAMAGMRTRVSYVAVLIAALQFGYETRLHFTRFITREFGGYARASALLNELGTSVPVFMLSQHNLWPSLSRNVSFLPNGPVDELPIPDDARQVYLVTDLYAYYKYGQRQYVGRLASLQDHVVVQIFNPLPFEAVENQLTLSELARLETDRAFRDQIFSIRVFRLTPAEARAALTGAGPGPAR